MRQITDYLDLLKEKTGSDYKTAQLMNCDRSVIAQIRKRGSMEDDKAIFIADYLGIDREEILLTIMINRTHGEVRKTWEKIAKGAGIAASGLILASIIGNDNYINFNKLKNTSYQEYTLCEVI